MKALRFRVQHFRNIDDSGWIDLDAVTAFVGRNESGKTSLLQALYRFNPGSEAPYDPQRDYPRERFHQHGTAAGTTGPPVCSVEFDLPVGLRQEIASLLPDGEAVPATATVHRHYDGSYTHDFSPALPEHSVRPAVLLDAFNAFAAKIRRSRPSRHDDPDAHKERRAEILQWVLRTKDALRAHDDLRSTDAIELLTRLRTSAEQYGTERTARAVELLLSAFDEVLDIARAEPPTDQICRSVQEHLPVFIYFENYGVLDSAIWFSRYLEDRTHNPADSRVRTVAAMFKQAGLNPNELATQGVDRMAEARRHGTTLSEKDAVSERKLKERRAISLNAASNEISAKFSNWWQQRRHTIRYDADGDFFRIWVTDNRRENVEIELENRSKGFQWFFSFYLVFLAESKGQHKDAILLLDEPGLHLHPTAQQELISFFEDLSKRNQILYTTHSPFLIDGENLDRVRPVTEDMTGRSRISATMWPEDRETIFPLQAAAGYAMMQGLFRHRRNLLVEGFTDYLYLTALSQHCVSSGRTGLPDDIYVVPCGGTKLVGALASLFLSEHVRPVILLDGDDAGRARKQALLKGLYSGYGARIVMLDEVLGMPGNVVTIENVVGTQAIVEAVCDLTERSLSLDGEIRVERSLPSQIESAAQRQGVDLPEGWKGSAALSLVSSWGKRPRKVPEETLDAAARVFGAVRDRFGDGPESG